MNYKSNRRGTYGSTAQVTPTIEFLDESDRKRTDQETQAFVDAVVRYAGFWRRFWAAHYDGVLLSVSGVGLGISLSPIYVRLTGRSADLLWAQPEVGYVAIFLLLCSILGWLYTAAFESSNLQATPGKIALGIAVTDLEGQRVSFGRATARYFAKLVSTFVFFLGFLIAAFTPKKQGLHDLMTDCLVIKKPNPNQRVFAVVGWLILILLAACVIGLLWDKSVPTAQQAQAPAKPEAADQTTKRAGAGTIREEACIQRVQNEQAARLARANLDDAAQTRNARNILEGNMGDTEAYLRALGINAEQASAFRGQLLGYMTEQQKIAISQSQLQLDFLATIFSAQLRSYDVGRQIEAEKCVHDVS